MPQTVQAGALELAFASTNGLPSPAGRKSAMGSLGRSGFGSSNSSSGVGRLAAMRSAVERTLNVRPDPALPTTTTWKRG